MSRWMDLMAGWVIEWVGAWKVMYITHEYIMDEWTQEFGCVNGLLDGQNE